MSYPFTVPADETDLEFDGLDLLSGNSVSEEPEAAKERRHMVDSMQRSLLAYPKAPNNLAIAARYLPAVLSAEVGGDWYDAFQAVDGSTVLSIGDVCGHDADAASAMAQLRNLLRGLAIDSSNGPSAILSRLDLAIAMLELDTIATSAVVRIAEHQDVFGEKFFEACCSSAGHPPPLMRSADGKITKLSGDSDLLLGVDHLFERSEQCQMIAADSTLVLYTDGLVERRGEDINVGIARLAEAFSHSSTMDPDQICEDLIDELVLDGAEDDIAMVVLCPVYENS